MIRISTTILLLSLLFSLTQLQGQSKLVDSLKIVLKNTNHDTIRCRILNDMIAAEPNDNIWPAYNQQLEEIAQKNQTKETGEMKAFYSSYCALALNNFGYLYKQRGALSKAFFYFNKALDIQKTIHDKIGIAGSLTNLGMLLRQQGNIPKALDFYYNSLKIQIEIDNKMGIATAYNNIGFIYSTQGEHEKALEYFNKALTINNQINDQCSIAICYQNIASIYNSNGNFFYKGTNAECVRKGNLKAIEYLNKAINIQSAIDDIYGLASSYNSLGSIYNDSGDPACIESPEKCKSQSQSKALECYLKSLKLRKEIKNKVGIAISLYSIAEIKFKQGKIEDAYNDALQSLKIANELGYPENIKDAAILLKKIYEKQGKFDKALESYQLFIQMKDSITSQENRQSTLKKQFQIEYEIQATRDSIANVLKIKEQQLKHQHAINQQRMYTLSGLAGFILMLIVAIVSYKAFQNKKKANTLLEQKNFEINQQKEEISTQRDEIEAHRDLVTHQKEELEEVHTEIKDSINYAQKIQAAILPNKDQTEKILGDHFILFKPKDVVSGDFFWAVQAEQWKIFCVADCTGHGVPGGFMSMLGIAFLKEIISKQNIPNPSQILDDLRRNIILTLNQKGQTGEQRDGMDISICVLNTSNNMLLFSGANNPLYIVTKEKILTVILADKQPVAFYEDMKPFTTHEKQLHPEDCLYMISDGFVDQFGGPKNKKFMSKNLKKLLINIADKSMIHQHMILNETFENWKGELEQIDDVTILGIRI